MDKIKFNYRNDIDGLRAISVLVVVFFHLGYLPNGYLGVDVFFVISGYLITGIIYRQNLINNFSILNFYMKRIRRILPLVTLIVLISFIVGLFVMLPNDLENLAQSIIATNLYSNNILQAITTRNYWDTLNEFKPLMHTWSLAIEEQYYLFYPFIFLVNKKYILKILILLTLISLILFLLPFPNEIKFYYLPFRFFELSLGGIVAIILNQKLKKTKLNFVFILLLLLFITFDFGLNNTILILLTILLSCAILASNNSVNKLSSLILENKFFIFIGKISFSIYMWHQLCFAYTRYFLTDNFDYKVIIFLFILIFFLSILSYYFIEQPFRNKKIISDKKVLFNIFSLTLLISIGSFVVITKGGLIRDVPELSLSIDNNTNPKIHEEYNDRNYLLNKNFENFNKIKILVIGDSFARDWINILIESETINLLEISYLHDFATNPNLTKRVKNADIIFLSRMDFSVLQKYSLPLNKTFCLGDKNFGLNNGLFYNYSKSNFCNQRAKVAKINLLRNEELKSQWGERFIDLIDSFIDKNNTVPVFTPDCKFISNDTRHLTKAGAIFYAKKINPQLKKIFNEANNTRP